MANDAHNSFLTDYGCGQACWRAHSFHGVVLCWGVVAFANWHVMASVTVITPALRFCASVLGSGRIVLM